MDDEKMDELGSCEGLLVLDLDLPGRRRFHIRDDGRGRAVDCIFPERLYHQARAAVQRRVLVAGRIKYTSAGQRASIRVEALRELRAQADLPQASDLEGIDITGGLDSVDYVRAQRDMDAR